MGLTENIINSLDKEELRYISKDVLMDKGSQAARLFELIQEHGDDEEKVASRFKRYAPKGNISVVRNQLQHILLKGLEDMHAPEYAFAEVNSLILQIQIFMDKSAFDIVKKLLDKALKMAEEDELFTHQVRLREMQIYLRQGSQGIEGDDVRHILDEYKIAMAKLANHSEYTFIWHELRLLTDDIHLIRNEQTRLKWEALHQHELLSDVGRATSKRAELRYWIIKANYFLTILDYQEARKCFESIVGLCEKYPFIKRSNPTNYFWALSQLAHIGYFLQDTDLMRKALDTIRETEIKSDAQEVAAFTCYTTYGLAYYDLLFDKRSKIELAGQAHLGLRKYISKVKPHAALALLVTCVSVWIEEGEYDRALDVVREFSEYIHTENKLDGKIILLFYELIAQIETGNEMMVNDTLQNFNRYLLRHNFKRDFEQLMVRFLKIVSSYSPTMKEELGALKEQLLLIPNKSVLDQMPALEQVLMTMIDSRLTGMKYHDYMRSVKVV